MSQVVPACLFVRKNKPTFRPVNFFFDPRTPTAFEISCRSVASYPAFTERRSNCGLSSLLQILLMISVVESEGRNCRTAVTSTSLRTRIPKNPCIVSLIDV